MFPPVPLEPHTNHEEDQVHPDRRLDLEDSTQEFPEPQSAIAVEDPPHGSPNTSLLSLENRRHK